MRRWRNNARPPGKAGHSVSLRTIAKLVAERALIWSGGAWLHRRRMSGRTLVLAYHNVVPDGTPLCGDRANHLPLALFIEQIAQLRETHDIVPLTDALEHAAGGGRRPRAAITFDDAYAGAVRYGVAELVRQGLPATIFVAPAYLGGRTFWWDALAGASGLRPDYRDRAMIELGGEHAAVMDWAKTAGAPVAEMTGAMISAPEQEVLDVANRPGITLGSHSWSHPNLTRLEPKALAAELARPMTWLREHVTSPLSWIAYPYGAFDATVSQAAKEAGYSAALGISGGWLARSSRDCFALPRVNVPPGMTPHGFAIRAAGLLCG